MKPRRLLAFLWAALLAGSCAPPQDNSAPPPPAASGGSTPAQSQLMLPGEAARLVNEGIVQYRQGRYHQAADSFAKARDQVPADLSVSTLLGTALLQAKRYVPAQEEFRRILTLHPEAVEPRLGLARIAIRLGEYDKATGLFREVLTRDPGNLQALYNLGLLRYRAGDYAEAGDLLGRLLQRKPDHPEAHVTLGLARARLGDEAAAEAEFRAAAALAPEASQAHFHLAALYVRQGRKEEAAKEQEIFKKLWDRQAADREAEGRVRDLFLAGNYPAALAEYDRLLQTKPDSGRFHLGRGQCFLKMGRKDEALASFEKAAELDPSLPDAFYHLAILYQERGEDRKSDSARRAFEALETLGENKTGF